MDERLDMVEAEVKEMKADLSEVREDLKEVKGGFQRVEDKIDQIMSNHLFHIYETLGALKGRWKVTIPVLVLLLGLTIGLYFA